MGLHDEGLARWAERPAPLGFAAGEAQQPQATGDTRIPVTLALNLVYRADATACQILSLHLRAYP